MVQPHGQRMDPGVAISPSIYMLSPIIRLEAAAAAAATTTNNNNNTAAVQTTETAKVLNILIKPQTKMHNAIY